MQLLIEGLTKKYQKHKLFENLSHTFSNNTVSAITGENGSGKSTIIKIIAGVIAPSKGTVTFIQDEKVVEKEKVFQLLGITAPYLDLIEEFTLQEHLDFQSKFRDPRNGSDIMEEIERANLIKSLNKQVGEFSSGMQQRLKLILCCSYDAKVLLLDEPTSHLDTKGVDWYKDLVNRNTDDRITLIASNNSEEYIDFAKKIITIENN